MISGSLIFRIDRITTYGSVRIEMLTKQRGFQKTAKATRLTHTTFEGVIKDSEYMVGT